jgi:hypothetical protein
MSMSSSSGKIENWTIEEDNFSLIKELVISDNDTETYRKDLPSPWIFSKVSSKCVACIIESRGVATEVGITVLNLDNGICNLYQISDTANYKHVLQILNIHSPEKVSSGDFINNVSLVDNFQ